MSSSNLGPFPAMSIESLEKYRVEMDEESRSDKRLVIVDDRTGRAMTRMQMASLLSFYRETLKEMGWPIIGHEEPPKLPDFSAIEAQARVVLPAGRRRPAMQRGRGILAMMIGLGAGS